MSNAIYGYLDCVRSDVGLPRLCHNVICGYLDRLRSNMWLPRLCPDLTCGYLDMSDPRCGYLGRVRSTTVWLPNMFRFNLWGYLGCVRHQCEVHCTHASYERGDYICSAISHRASGFGSEVK
eukprot:jgi/Botrbrau1/1513/Bobra.0107s0001.1